jgi:hypothetical protein
MSIKTLTYQKIVTQISDQFVVCGDFNAHHKLWNYGGVWGGGKRNDTKKGNHLHNRAIENKSFSMVLVLD